METARHKYHIRISDTQTTNRAGSSSGHSAIASGAEALISATGNPMMPAYILIVAGVTGGVTPAFMPELAGKRLSGSGPAVESAEEAHTVARILE